MKNTDWIIQILEDLADFANKSGMKESQHAFLIAAAIFEVELYELNKGKKLLEEDPFLSRFCTHSAPTHVTLGRTLNRRSEQSDRND